MTTAPAVVNYVWNDSETASDRNKIDEDIKSRVGDDTNNKVVLGIVVGIPVVVILGGVWFFFFCVSYLYDLYPWWRAVGDDSDDDKH